MPVVPLYQESVGEDGGMSARQQSYASPEAAGSGVAAAVGDLGGDVSSASKYLDAWEQTQDEARAKQISTQFTPLVRTALYDPDNGFLNQSGVNALNAKSGAQTQINNAYDDALDQAQNPRQKALLAQSLGEARNSALQQIDQHTAQQGKVYYTAASDAVAAEHQQTYVASLDTDPQTAQANLQAGEAEVIRSNTFAGLGQQAEAQALQKYHTQAFSQVLDKYLASGTAAGAYKAQGFYLANGARMDTDTATKYQERINTAVNAQGAADAATAAAGHQANAAAPMLGSPTGNVAQQNMGLVAQAGGTPVEQQDLARFGQLEDPSGQNIRNPLPGATSYGRWQFTNGTWAALGGTAANRSDPAVQAQMALKLYRQNAAGLTQALGRAPTSAELYLAHQQGLGAARTLLKADPNEGAVQALTDAGVAHAQSAIVNNLPASLKAQGAAVTTGQFLQAWSGKVNSAAASAAVAPGGNAGTNPTTGQPTGVIGTKEDMVADAVSRAPPGASAAVQATYRQAASAEWDRQHAAITATQTAADNQIDLLFASDHPPKAITDIPPAILQQASPAKQRSTYTTLSKDDEDGSFAKQSDPETYQQLAVLHANNDPRLANFDVSGIADKLSAADYKQVVGWKADILSQKPTTPKQISLKSSMEIANTQLKAAGYTPRNNPKEIAQFQTALQNQMSNWRVSNPGKEPQDGDITKMTDALLIHGSWQQGNGLFGPNVVNGPIFQAPTGTPTRVIVPPDAAAKIISSYAQHRPGQPPSAMEIRSAYFNGHAAGIFK